MSLHELWHVTVLTSTLFAAAGLAIVLLAPLVFDPPPPGLMGARPLVFALAGVAALLLVAEWTAIH
ncbi:MAG: hypothetical protein M3360_06100 [Actinomycetota bacterium]|nr:hypothetical protein [Actinomycetota bacterium]